MARQCADPPRGLQAVSDGHPHIGQQHVEIPFLNLGDGRLAIRDLGHGVAGGAEKINGHAAGYVRVVGEQDAEMPRLGGGDLDAASGECGGRLGRHRGWKLSPEQTSPARVFGVPDRSPHDIDKAFRGPQAQTGTWNLSRGIEAVVFAEQAASFRRRNSRSGIRDLKPQALRIARDPQCDGSLQL